jgi:hypothetical protein
MIQLIKKKQCCGKKELGRLNSKKRRIWNVKIVTALSSRPSSFLLEQQRVPLLLHPKRTRQSIIFLIGVDFTPNMEARCG